MSTPWDITPSCKVLSIALNKNYNVVVKIWKAFSLLLELSCKIDHTMVLNQIVRAGDLRVEEVRDSFTQRVEDLQNQNSTLKAENNNLTTFIEDLSIKHYDQADQLQSMKDDYENNIKDLEKEVQTRLLFENRLNDLHSVHRDLSTKYETAIKELGNYSTNLKSLADKNNLNEEKVENLVLESLSHENRANINEERVSVLKSEIDSQNSLIQELKNKIDSISKEKDLEIHKLRLSNRSVPQLEEKIDILQDQLTSLKLEKS